MSLSLRKWVRFGALGTAVIGFMVGSVLSVKAIGDYYVYEEKLHRAGSWLAVQAHAEYLNLLTAIERAARMPGASDEVILRFDLLWSRLPLILESKEAELLAETPDAVATAAELLEALRGLEPMMEDFVRSPDPIAVAPLVGVLEPFGPRLQRLVQATTLTNHDHGRVKSVLERRALTMLAVTFATGALLVLMLVIEARGAAVKQRRARLADMRLRSAFEAACVGFVLFDADERFVACNRHFQDMYGLSADEVEARRSFEQMIRLRVEQDRFPDAVADPAGWVDRRVARFRSASSDHEQRLADGRWIEVRERRLPDGSSIGVRIDITELKRREQALAAALARAEAASHAKSEFLATMSHELRTPLNAIIGFTELMKVELFGPLGNPRYADYVDDIHASGEHLLGVINDILDMARIETGKLELHEELVRLDELVDASLRIVRHKALDAGLDLDVRIPAELPPVVIDRQRIRQVLVNLLSNAIKFTPAGGTIRMEGGLDGAGIELRVSDTGIGMSDDEIPVALAPFGQVGSSYSRRFEGTGLGLPISRALVEGHGGTLRIESRPGSGTMVRVRLPASRIAGRQPHIPEPRREAAERPS
ncbi:PAS domain-containing sensor histidine kinase [Arenibaculum sp.]|jgi:two-component system cell cycle sensor histidine kinase PleC|uniref:PAS domain-containing sensor histidine kinase n=1 Tax=Arenibaculum sp. TaxID=2865862 RepID=UPI002E120002|nr:ATP-binding protein [Arenibaculum sp.]